MSYGIDLSTEAQHKLARLPIPVRQQTFRELQRLAASPTALSRPSHFPFPERGQLFDFSMDSEGRRWTIYIMFQFGQDERTLHVGNIGFESADLEHEE